MDQKQFTTCEMMNRPVLAMMSACGKIHVDTKKALVIRRACWGIQVMGVTINADDFGASRSVNEAIVMAATKGILNSASVLATGEAAAEALAAARDIQGLEIGVHLNATDDTPLSDPREIPLLVGEDGDFRNRFLNLLWLSLSRRRELEEQVEREFRAQIEFVKNGGMEISHLNSHHHAHAIPALSSVVQRLQKEYSVPRMRILNESFWATLVATRNWRCFDSGLLKYVVLKSLYYVTRVKSDVYFYSVVHTMRLFGQNVAKIRVPKGFDAIEINVHPNLEGEDRLAELSSVMDKGLLSRITFR